MAEQPPGLTGDEPAEPRAGRPGGRRSRRRTHPGGTPSVRRRVLRGFGVAALVTGMIAAILLAMPEPAERSSVRGAIDGGAATPTPGPQGGSASSGTAQPTPTGASLSPTPGPGAASGPLAGTSVASITVSGPRLVDGRGRTVRLLGYNFSGTEYSCIEGQGIFDTPDGTAPSDQVLRAMVDWTGTTAVRLPLNEQCWLGLGVDARYSGPAYRSAIASFVQRLNRFGLVAILDLHRSAPADARSLEQEPMPDRDHSPAFWTSVAATFRGWPGVAFDLFNEPFPFDEANSARAWTCWRNGGCRLTSANSGQTYVAAGMSELLARVRATGARNVVFLGGLYWAESLTQWLRYRPADPAGQLGASFHAYSFNDYCVTTACYNRDLGPVTAKVPLLVGEIGPDLTLGSAGIDQNCPASAPTNIGFDATAFAWFDRHGAGYTAWSWNPWNDCWSLVRDWHGTPTSVWGVQFRTRLRASRP